VADASIILYNPPVAAGLFITEGAELSELPAIERFLPGGCLELACSGTVGRSLAVLRIRLGLMFLATGRFVPELLCRGPAFRTDATLTGREMWALEPVRKPRDADDGFGFAATICLFCVVRCGLADTAGWREG